ncbi:hypothetical protein PR202_ga17019 [Eleusine coracana subsp. coracana]|uniref:Uncharacterized protein n=1 Tax=Eleusine coracana subsp. coracana TaxID=191504 RepID=A0AAV5CP66_ELECO|nr:hypothetical protein PR202_ga17019 [Eleusine coracana subsp. coracana]
MAPAAAVVSNLSPAPSGGTTQLQERGGSARPEQGRAVGSVSGGGGEGEWNHAVCHAGHPARAAGWLPPRASCRWKSTREGEGSTAPQGAGEDWRPCRRAGKEVPRRPTRGGKKAVARAGKEGRRADGTQAWEEGRRCTCIGGEWERKGEEAAGSASGGGEERWQRRA